MPERIQLRRTKGWRMPPNTVKVTRPGRWGNPFRIGDYGLVGDPDPKRAGPFRMAYCITSAAHASARYTFIDTPETAVELFQKLAASGFYSDRIAELRGQNLACWCPLDRPCHADVLLAIANSEVQ